jgi:hypothetical protein
MPIAAGLSAGPGVRHVKQGPVCGVTGGLNGDAGWAWTAHHTSRAVTRQDYTCQGMGSQAGKPWLVKKSD